MEIYNTKISYYKNHMQVKVYDNSVKKGEKKNKVLVRTSEQVQEELKEKENYLKEYYGNDTEKAEQEIEKLRYKRRSTSAYSSTQRTKKTILEYLLSNDWEYFCTFTFNPRLVDRTDFYEVSRKLSKWLQHLKEIYAPDLMYVVVPELHEDKKSYHFHAVMSNIGKLQLSPFYHRNSDNDSVTQVFSKSGQTIYVINQWRYGYSTAIELEHNAQSSTKIAYYMTKYITKDLCSNTINRRRYWVSRSTVSKPVEEFFNIDFDGIDEYIKQVFDDNLLYYKEITSSYRGKIKYIDVSY